MATASGDRSQHFPAIEKKHGQPISNWIDRVKDLGEAKYPEQISYLRENFGFSQTHANAVVMYVRGSTSSKKFATPTEYFKTLDPAAAKTVKEIFAAITKKYPKMELVMAWNQPNLRLDGKYIIGVSVAKSHILLNPFSKSVLDDFSEKLTSYKVSKHTFQVPIDWKVNATLLQQLARARSLEQ